MKTRLMTHSTISLIRKLLLIFLFPVLMQAQVVQDPYPAYSPTIYGSAVNAEELTNQRVDGQKVSFKFRAKHTGSISSIRIYIMARSFRWPGYGAGNGGTWRVSLRNDDGTSNHWPVQSVLTSLTRNMIADSGAVFPLLSFNSPVSVTAGTLYHIVFENTDATPAVNFTSVNTLLMPSGHALTPEQPFAADSDWACLLTVAPYTVWEKWPSTSSVTPIMEYYYTDGYSTGMGYMEVWVGDPKTISGSSAVRETFTVTGSNRNVSTVKVWLRRLSGDQPLTLRLEKTDGTLLEQGSILASSIPTTYSWITYTFQSTQSLVVGQSYNLTLSAPAGTSYDTYSVWDGSAIFTSNTRFADGYSQFTTGSGWIGQTNGDLMFYFSLASSGTPTLTVSPTSLSFGNVIINTISSEQTYILTGSNLSSAIDSLTITAPSGFTLSTVSGSGFTSSKRIAYTGGTLSAKTIYVRFSPTAVQSYSDSITNGGGGAATKNVLVSGNGLSDLPTPTGTFIASSDTLPARGGSVTITWTSSNASSASINNGIGTVATNGSITRTIRATTRFTLTLSNINGNTPYVKDVYVRPQKLSQNKALNMSSTASSVELTGVEANKANDGNASTRWSSTYIDNQ
jgi:hypothetical protein